MNPVDNQIFTLLSLDMFRVLASNQNVSLLTVNTVLTMLVKQNIPFDISYTPATRRNELSIQLTIYINPNTTLVYTVNPNDQGNPNAV